MQVCYIQQKYQVYYQVNTFDDYFKKYVYSSSDPHPPPPPPPPCKQCVRIGRDPTLSARTYFMDDPQRHTSMRHRYIIDKYI